jgi:MarR family transcriptional regulator, organic hydroperoxide resistance regulator
VSNSADMPPSADHAKTIETVMNNLRRVFKAINDRSKLAEHTAGLTGPQLWALKVLAEHGPVRVSDLATRMYLHPSTVVGILDRLETKGLAARQRLTEDRRVVNAALTGKGKTLVRKMPAVAQEMLLSGLETLSPKDLAAVARGLEIQVRILGAQGLPPQLLLSNEVNAPRRPQSPVAGPRQPAKRTKLRAT